MRKLKRREHGSGGMRERRPTVWELKYDIGVDPISGKRRTRYKTFHGKRHAAQIELRRLVNQVDEGEHIDLSTLSVAAHLERWADHMVKHWSPKTAERNLQIINNNLKPALGHIKLKSLSTHRIDHAWTWLLENGRADGRGGLSAQTIKHCHRLLSQSLKQAIKWRFVRGNPADDAKLPAIHKKESKTLTPHQTIDLLKALKGHRYYIPVLVAVMTGLRRGEVLALRWHRIDLETGIISVTESLEQSSSGLRYKSPKSGKTRLVAISKLLVEELRVFKLKQAELLLQRGIRQSDDALLCAQANGDEFNPEDLSRRFPELLIRLGLPRITFHELRHTHATQLLQSGVHMKVMSERLGHSDIGITMNLYSHVVDGMQQDAVDLLDNTLNSARKARPKTS
jgi:integrase